MTKHKTKQATKTKRATKAKQATKAKRKTKQATKTDTAKSRRPKGISRSGRYRHALNPSGAPDHSGEQSAPAKRRKPMKTQRPVGGYEDNIRGL